MSEFGDIPDMGHNIGPGLIPYYVKKQRLCGIETVPFVMEDVNWALLHELCKEEDEKLMK